MFVDFNILNQLGSPSINSNTFANRPAAGQTGRLFVSTDTFEIYRDNGTGWDLIGGPGSSTVTGSGATGQVTYWTGTNTVSGENALFWDAANNRLGINTATPTAHLDVHSAADVAIQLNGTGATPTVLQQFLSAGVAQYELGYNWNASADYRRFSIYDVVGAKEVITIDQQSRYVGINYQYSSLSDQPAYTLDVSGSARITDSILADTNNTTQNIIGGTTILGTQANIAKLDIIGNATQNTLFFDVIGARAAYIGRSARLTLGLPDFWNLGALMAAFGVRPWNGTEFVGGGNTFISFAASENQSLNSLGGQIQFTTTTNGNPSGTVKAILTNDGKFLLGTTVDTGQLLQVNGNAIVGGSGNPELTITSSSGAYTGLLYINAAGGGSSKIFGNGGANQLLLGTNNVDRLTIDNNGIKTENPTTGTAAAWKLGSRVAAAVVLDATQYIEVEVGGTFYKLAIVT